MEDPESSVTNPSRPSADPSDCRRAPEKELSFWQEIWEDPEARAWMLESMAWLAGLALLPWLVHAFSIGWGALAALAAPFIWYALYPVRGIGAPAWTGVHSLWGAAVLMGMAYWHMYLLRAAAQATLRQLGG